MKILLCHNYYLQPGGEDQVFADEGRLLESHGHEVIRHTADNRAIASMSRVKLAWRTLWNSQSYREVRALIRRERPDVMHCTNIFPLLSQSIYYAAQAEKVPVVQSLHNFRMLCANAILRTSGPGGRPCPVGGFFRCLRQGCYRNNSLATLVVLLMVRYHRWRQTWTRAVNHYIALTNFCRGLFVEYGLPSEIVSVKPNFVANDPGPGRGDGGYAVFVGRLSWEKGIHTMLDAWQGGTIPIPLKVVGDGPLAADVQKATTTANVQWLGRRPVEEVLRILADARCLIFPSIWHETFGRTIIEAYAVGTPVIAASMGSAAELVDDGRTGHLFQPGNAEELTAKVRQFVAAGDEQIEMRLAARREFEEKYTPERNYSQLMEIYHRAGARTENKRGGSPAIPPPHSLSRADTRSRAETRSHALRGNVTTGRSAAPQPTEAAQQ
jgi:glycosyltransferase involved in cell wall biosynthesis